MELLAQEYSEQQNVAKEKVIREMTARERRAGVFRKIGHHIGGKTTNPLTNVLVPDDPTDIDNTTWTSIVESEAIWEALLQHGRHHFSQADQTPFVAGPIAEFIGPYEFNEYSEQILQGTFDVDAITNNIEVRDIVKAMRYEDPTSPAEFNCNLTMEQLKTGFRNAKESTASSPTGLHYGIWKSLLHDDDLFKPFGSMIQFAFQWGVPPKQWECIVQPLLEKDPGDPKVTRLRRISLVDSAMNMGFRIIYGHRMMKAAERNSSFDPNQHGARNGHMGIGAVLEKRLSYDMARLLRAALVAFDCDATACYDRMIPSICMNLARREGVTENANKAHLKLAKEMKYKVKTAYGVSPESFSNTDEFESLGRWQETTADNINIFTLLGMWQGSAAVGALWGLVSGMLFRILKGRHGTTRFPSPDPTIYTERIGEAFVDDTTLWLFSLTITLPILLSQMQVEAQDWERLLWTTGGALNLKKCFWYGVQWKWTKTGEPRMMTIDETPDLSIKLTAGADRTSTKEIKRIEVSEGKRTLGARLEPQGTDKAELKHRISEGKLLRRRLLRAPTDNVETGTAFDAVTRPAFEYVLPTTCFNHKQCKDIQNTYFPTYLSKMGINQKTPAAVRSGPELYGGMDKREIWTAQGSGHDKVLISFLRKQDTVGQQLDIELRTLQLQAGVSWNVLSREGAMVRKYVDHCWATQTWEFNDKYDLSL